MGEQKDTGDEQQDKGDSGKGGSGKGGSGKGKYHLRMWVFCVMLVLALAGMGLTMSLDKGGWEYWLFVLFVYGGVCIFWAWERAKQSHQPAWKMVRDQALHWGGVLVVFAILLLFERTEVINREAASNVALLVLALACFLAGVHFDWAFLLLGVVLAIMAVAIGYLEQYIVWIIVLPVLIAAGFAYYKVRDLPWGRRAT